MLLLLLATPHSAHAQTLTVLHTFAGGTDGSSASGLNRDAAGNLYGITVVGGASNLGKVFKLGPTGTETVLHSFAGGSDGANPSSLIRDSSGNLYGTTSAGGPFASGAIFKLDATGKESVLYSFPGGTGGASPGALIRDAAGNLYGTGLGGTFGAGIVFKLSASGQASVLFNFPSSTAGQPVGGLALDASDNLYGTTAGLTGACIFQGRELTCGTVYKVDPAGGGSLLFRFRFDCCGNGAIPQAGLVRDAAGNLYGTTAFGGAAPPFMYGTVFKLRASGFSATTLHNFAGTDGSNPHAGLLLDAAGNLYGTTTKGGAYGLGTVFELNTSSRETVLHSFTGGADGATPNSSLIADPAGNLYGATSSGGTSGFGTVFKLAPSGTLSVANNVADSAARN
jgi:uncharacterized repeat protein (TIGR03803 family)